jgi:molybdopterin-guanine dinucleotide biosynthesis protein A
MGRDKATLTVDGAPLWSNQLALLRELEPDAICVSARETPSWLPQDVAVVLDAVPSRGPLSGIAEALHRMQSSHLLVLAVDLPRMTSGHLRKLASRTEPGCGIIAKSLHHFEPLSAIYPKEAASIAQNTLADSDVSMLSFARKLLQQGLLKPYDLASDELGLYLNFNAPGDLRD